MNGVYLRGRLAGSDLAAGCAQAAGVIGRRRANFRHRAGTWGHLIRWTCARRPMQPTLSDRLIIQPREAVLPGDAVDTPPVLMANEARRPPSQPPASLPARPSRDTRHPSRPERATASYELHALAAKATDVSATPADDGPDLLPPTPDSSLHSLDKTMSRVPLLVRSSPAQGTGKLTLCDAPCSLPRPSPREIGAQEQWRTRRTPSTGCTC